MLVPVPVDIINDDEAKAASLLDTSSPTDGQKTVLYFWAEWHAPSAIGGPFDTVVKTLTAQNGADVVKFYRVLAEEAPTLSRKVRVHRMLWLFWVITTVTFLFAAHLRILYIHLTMLH